MSHEIKAKGTQVRRAPVITTSDEFYSKWEGYESDDFVEVGETPINAEDEALAAKLRPYFSLYSSMKEPEIDLIYALWRIAGSRPNRTQHLSFPHFCLNLGIINPLAYTILRSNAVESCNLDGLFTKLNDQGYLKFPGLINYVLEKSDIK